MSKRGYISRYLLILKKLKRQPYSTYEELQAYIENQFEYLLMQDDTLNVCFSKRTLQRDLKEIRNIFGIDIEYSKKHRGYYISEIETENMNFQRMIEAFDMFNSLNLAQDLADFIQLEKRRSQGTEHLYGLLHAIKNRLRIAFTYQKFWEDKADQRLVEPYALKEFKNRWYVIAKDLADNNTKSFALDRLSALEITNHAFVYPEDFSVERSYHYCYGIISPNGEQPQDIILSFTALQGKYVKTLPLHHTQQILEDSPIQLRVKLKLCLTHDFIMELLSFGENVKVIEPAALVAQIKEAHRRAYMRYSY